MLEIKEEYFGGVTLSGNDYYVKIPGNPGLCWKVACHCPYSSVYSRKIHGANSRQKEYVEKFILITDYINNHFAEDLSLETVASQAGFSKFHFSQPV